MSVTGEFERYLKEWILRLRSESGSQPQSLAARLEAVATDSQAELSARAARVLAALAESDDSWGGTDPDATEQARADLSRICRIVLGR